MEINLLGVIFAALFLERVHEIGDYWLQNSWMARNKAFKVLPAFVHSSTYYGVFHVYWSVLELSGVADCSLGERVMQIILVGLTHFCIDHFQLPALYSFWLNGKFEESYEYEGRSYALFENGVSFAEFVAALKERRWIRLPAPVPPHVILSIDQSWHKTCNAIAFVLTVLI